MIARLAQTQTRKHHTHAPIHKDTGIAKNFNLILNVLTIIVHKKDKQMEKHNFNDKRLVKFEDKIYLIFS